MSFEFIIPLSRDDLLSRTGLQQYVVDEVCSLRLLPTKLQECKGAFRTKGPLFILENFDSLFSIFVHSRNVSSEIKEDVWYFFLQVLPAYTSQLVDYLEPAGGEFDHATRSSHLNAVKMWCYLLCLSMDTFENEISRPITGVGVKGRKKSTKSVSEFCNLDWDVERERGVRALLHLLQLNLHRLWEPPVAEEEFVNLVTNTCYKLLENPNITRVTSKSTRDLIFQLLGVMVKRYNHALGCSLKLLTLLQHFEHLAAPLAQAVQLFTQQYGVKTIATEMMREIGRMDSKDLTRDSSGTRAYATFLVELAEKIPDVMQPNISVLLGLLDGESFSMRNCVLGVLGEILVQMLTNENLDEKQKTTRDQFLDELEDHIHDINAHVRSKTMQIWLNIVNEKALPLPRQHRLLEFVIGRLEDKSSQVRRHAIQLVTGLLKNNPFAAKLPLEELRVNYEKEKQKLAEMMPDRPAELSAQETANRQLEEAWDKIEKEVKANVAKVLGIAWEGQEEEVGGKGEEEDRQEEGSGQLEDLISEDDTIQSVKQNVMQKLKDGQFLDAIKLYQAAKEAWPLEAAFNIVSKNGQAEDCMEHSAIEEEEGRPKEEVMLQELKLIFFGEQLESHLMRVVANKSLSPQQSHDASLVNEMSKQQVLVQYLKDSMSFVVQVQRAVPVVVQLLGSRNVTDVLEAIDFFVTGFEFGLSNAMLGIRKMLVLIWSKEAGVKEAVVNAYRRLYLTPQGGNLRSKALDVANNLTALTVAATVGDLTSLDQLVCEFVKMGELSQGVITVLWERFALKIPGTTRSESHGALVLLGMAAGAQVEIVRSNIDVLVKEGLGSRAEKDFILAKETCVVLLKLAGTEKKKVGEQAAEPFRLPKDHDIFKRLETLLVWGLNKLGDPYWLPMAEQAVNVTYKLAEHPDLICGEILKKAASVVLAYGRGQTQGAQSPGKDVPTVSEEEPVASTLPEMEAASIEPGQGVSKPPAEEASESSQPAPPSPSKLGCPAAILTRMLSLAGHVALRQLVHLDMNVFGEIKRRQAVQEEQDEKKKKTQSQQQSVTASGVKRSKRKSEPEPCLEEEMGLAGATAEDAEAEFIDKIVEKEVVTGTNLLALLRPLLVSVCNNQKKYPDPELQAAASLALAKFMLVSSEFCDAHLQLLFTILEKSPYPVIRANTIIALGDMTFRFPNLIEPWTPNLYGRLRDESIQVRKNTLVMLTHLIMNDQVKVKGQISEMASCIVDDNERISNLAKLFFHELSHKGNSIYNIMPDMVSRLSDPDIGVNEENFRTIMRYLFAFIQKDKQCESLVEKLCHRFRVTTSERQWRDLAFCLSLLAYSDKPIRKLQENFACFGDKLGDNEIHDCFITILNGARKFAKPEMKALVDELEEQIEQCHSKGMEDMQITAKAGKASAAARAHKSTTRTPGHGKGRGKRTPLRERRRQMPSCDGVMDSDEEFHPARRSTRIRSKVISFSDSDDEEEEEELFRVDEEAASSRSISSKIDEEEELENSDPNAAELSPQPRIVKSRHKSVNNLKAHSKKQPAPTTRARQSSRKT